MPAAPKIACALLALTGFSAACAQTPAGSWRLLENGPVQNYARHDDLSFVNATTGWVVNYSGSIFKTADGGASWTEQLKAVTDENLPVRFRSAGFANEQTGWVGSLTPDYVLYETRDGGETWDNISARIEGPTVGGLCGLWVVDEQTVYGAGTWWGDPRFVKSIDGGQTWTSRDMSDHAATLVDLYFFDENHGIAVGASEPIRDEPRVVVLMTDDGGETWMNVHTSSRIHEWGWKISFPTPLDGFVSVEGEDETRPNETKILKTADGGLTWQDVVVHGTSSLQGIGFITKDVGWVGGHGQTLMTTDGGVTWRARDVPDGSLNRIRILSDTLGYAVGEQVYKYSAGLATATDDQPHVPALFDLVQNHPNPFVTSTMIRYILFESAPVRLTVFDQLGRVVTVLVDDRQGPGGYEQFWDAKDSSGRPISSGVYLYQLAVGDVVSTRRMVVIR